MIGEADLDVGGAFDDVIVGDDVAGLVDHEARAERLLARRLEGRSGGGIGLDGGLAAGRDLDDARRAAPVDLAHGRPPPVDAAGVTDDPLVRTTVVVPPSPMPSATAPASAAAPPRRAAPANAASVVREGRGGHEPVIAPAS